MLRRPLLANVATVLAITAFMPLPAVAQSQEQPERQERDTRSTFGRATDSREVVEDYRRRSDGNAATAAAGPEVIAAAQRTATAAGLSCQVTSAASPGEAADGSTVYEAACESGPGYILVASTPPSANNCLVLAESERRARAENPAAQAGIQCSLPENLDSLSVLAAYAASANLNCQVDAGVWRGRTTANEERYEVGCAGSDGYWIEVAPSGEITNTIDCLEVARAGQACEFTTAEEQVATVRASVAGSSAPACDIVQVASKGANDTGRFYEVKCADDSGYIYRTSTAGAFEQAYPCIEASQIAGGCQLVDVSAAVEAEAQTRLQRVTALGFPCAVTQEAKLGEETGGQQRELYEFECSDRPLGVIAFLPTQGSEGAQAMDCLSVRVRGASCRFTTEDEIKAVMTSIMSAGGNACTVEDYAAIAPMDDGEGEFMEVKCDDGRGLLANFPASRDQTSGRVLTCAQAASREYECYL